MRRYFLIIISLFISFVLTNYFNNNLFLADSPKVNPFYLSNLRRDVINTRSKVIAFFVNPFKGSDSVVNTAEIPAILFQPVTKGVSAYEVSEGQSYLKVEKGTQYKIRQIQLSDGTIVNAIDFTGE